jgi:hypothetical protein
MPCPSLRQTVASRASNPAGAVPDHGRGEPNNRLESATNAAKSRKRRLLVSLADKPLVGLTSTTKDPKLVAAVFGMAPKHR